MLRLILVRHGESTYNAERRIQGQIDCPLSKKGHTEAEKLGQRLASWQFDAAYASDLKRAWQTAEHVAAHHTLTVRPDARLREFHLGAWQDKIWPEVEAEYAESLAEWRTNRELVPHGGEALSQVTARVGAFLADVQRDHPGETVLVVSHGGALRTLICVALDFPPSGQWNLALDNTAISELCFYPQGAVLHALNDTCHLQT